MPLSILSLCAQAALAGRSGNWGQSPCFLHISRKNIGLLGVRDRVEYVASPSREELVRLYQEASVFALPSDEEGLGMVILEATSCAVPVVSTRSGGPDGIITDGEDGFLVPLDDAAAMAGRLQSLLENPSLNIAMGSKARATIEARHDERVAGAVFVEMWDRLAGQ